MIERLSLAISPDVSITLLADRGFGDQVLYQVLDLLGWHYVIRFRGIIAVEHAGTTKPAAEWLPPSGRATKLAGARVTGKKTEVGAVVIVKAAGMKDIVSFRQACVVERLGGKALQSGASWSQDSPRPSGHWPAPDRFGRARHVLTGAVRAVGSRVRRVR